ncbi:MAG: hypothetical protein P8J61_09905 [Gammaproteobacteria bacterium]|nr:hypothetical protein [Gammaproteobacteria bacterium]
MKRSVKKFTTSMALVLLGSIMATSVTAQSVDDLIAEAVRPLPEDLRADATVYTYDDGDRVVLRQGTNQVECVPKNPATGFIRCNATSNSERMDYSAKLSSEGLGGAELTAAMDQAVEDRIIDETVFGSIRYRLTDEDDTIKLLWIVQVPYAMPEDLGMSTESQFQNSLAGQGRPWLMLEGTSSAHVMIPINATESSNMGAATTRLNTMAIMNTVEQATLPLPEEFRAGATVVQYDSETGARQVLRQGTNLMECQPRAESGFTRCYHQIVSAEQDIRALLAAQGASQEQIQEAVAEAIDGGDIATAPSGSMMYRLYEEDDRLKLLWVIRLPNASSEQTGMSIGSQRDNSLDGMGKPWMMRDETPAAHLMIPINGTELSN